MSQSTVFDLLGSTGDNREVRAKGWIRTKRDSKNIIFFEINDGSCMKGLQVVVDKEQGIVDDVLNPKLTTGASVDVEGRLVPSQGKGQGVELLAETVEVLGEAPEDYPLQKKRHSFEFLRDIAHLRPRTNTFGAVTRVRNTLSAAVHVFFQERGFLWIHTPIITGSDAEGAGNMFQVTTLDPSAPPRNAEGEVDYSQDFFGKKAHLTVSGQLQVENFACSMSNVYTFGPTFRAENSNTSRHLSEFWMIEPEMAFCDLDGNRHLAEDFIKYLLSRVLENCEEDMDFFNRWIEKGNLENLRKVLETPFAHLTYTDAIAELEKASSSFEFKPSWGIDLQAEHEKFLTESVVGGPLTVTDYPKDIKAFYMKQNDDGKTVRAMDVLVPRLGEIIGGSQREDNFDKLHSRITQMGMDPQEYDWYLDLRKYGSVPHSGFGLGFERMVQYVTGMQNIRDVIPFPRAPKTISF
ncbi:MAG: asparagine--tRNA ligase [Spirochaetaceae bacterium]|nr:asparagine--tRNA ligase [Spirochaetaceae bacterium]MDT8298165.1 asparagine--tRNA ligase [Spirochaetaceae bacterium]